ncbi:hypothetical protein B0H16DRAFT_1717717 [Mycena metata]|uniref:Uncharacterized protein n=1 Tax=Mycena metata TaxID=1033252 RepID=A0AAD7JKB9_9AGAR|nr:hypothetical protein B0H16DRAFT_1717717 [Mycena metata]
MTRLDAHRPRPTATASSSTSSSRSLLVLTRLRPTRPSSVPYGPAKYYRATRLPAAQAALPAAPYTERNQSTSAARQGAVAHQPRQTHILTPSALASQRTWFISTRFTLMLMRIYFLLAVLAQIP